MVFLLFLQHEWSMTSMRLKTKKRKSTLLKSKSLDNFFDTSTNLINHSTDGTSPPPFYTKRPNKIQFPKFNLFPKRHHSSHQKSAPLPFSPVQHPPLPNYTHKNFHPNDNLTTQNDTLINNSVTSTTDTPLKIYSRINYPFPPPSSRTLSQFFVNSFPAHLPTTSSFHNCYSSAA